MAVIQTDGLLTAGELDNIANAALDYYINRGEVINSLLEDKPLLQAMERASKTFPGGKGEISAAVKGSYSTTVSGYNPYDQVDYVNPANIKQVKYAWKEHHAGIGMSYTELKNDGISVSDDTGSSTRNLGGREQQALANLMEDKMQDLVEGYTRGMNTLLFEDGSTDTAAFAGIRALIKDDPTTGSVGGLDQAPNSWWRSRSSLAIAVNTTTNDALVEFLHTEIRQLKRYGGNPTIAVCGSDFMDQLGREVRRNGYYTQTGFNKKIDVSVGDIAYGGIVFKYDPQMDEMDLAAEVKDGSKRCYIIDPSKLCMYYMTDEKMKRHSPTRPHDYYVLYRAITSTCALVATQLNCHGVYELAP
jgi:hypothetical protein